MKTIKIKIQKEKNLSRKMKNLRRKDFFGEYLALRSFDNYKRQMTAYNIIKRGSNTHPAIRPLEKRVDWEDLFAIIHKRA